MKKLFALLLAAVMCFSLAACGGETASDTQPRQSTNAPAETGQETTPQQEESAAEEEVYTKEGTLKNGGTYTAYHKGGPDGPLMRVEYTYDSGAYGEEVYTEEGKMARMFFREADGTTLDSTFYPSGNMEKDIITYPDGSYDEMHYADDGYVEEGTGYLVGGTVTYQAHVTADGKVEVLVSGVEVMEDGTWWETQELENGATTRIHYGEDYKIIEEYHDNPAGGYSIKTLYYENGKQKEATWTYTDSIEYRYYEFYENGVPKTSHTIGADEREIKYQCDEEGYYTYYYDHDQYGVQEYFAGENHELVKYVENDKVYEGDAISEDRRNVFKQMQDMAAEVAYNMINGI